MVKKRSDKLVHELIVGPGKEKLEVSWTYDNIGKKCFGWLLPGSFTRGLSYPEFPENSSVWLTILSLLKMEKV